LRGFDSPRLHATSGARPFGVVPRTLTCALRRGASGAAATPTVSSPWLRRVSRKQRHQIDTDLARLGHGYRLPCRRSGTRCRTPFPEHARLVRRLGRVSQHPSLAPRRTEATRPVAAITRGKAQGAPRSGRRASPARLTGRAHARPRAQALRRPVPQPPQRARQAVSLRCSRGRTSPPRRSGRFRSPRVSCSRNDHPPLAASLARWRRRGRTVRMTASASAPIVRPNAAASIAKPGARSTSRQTITTARPPGTRTRFISRRAPSRSGKN
jgi:hypothetical protein